MTRAYSYIRFSTPEQAHGDSLRRQIELSEEYAKEHKLIFDRSLNLQDKGLSGFTGENRKKGALAVFLKAVETGVVAPGSYLLVESLDRLSRDTLSKQMSLFMELVNADITVVTLADKQIYNKETIDTDFSRLMISLVIMMRSHEESMMKSRRLVAMWNEKRRNLGTVKLTSTCPHWLKLNPDRKSFKVLEDRAQLVRRIYQMALDGYGQEAITKTLNREKIPTWGRNNGWYQPYIHKLLNNRAVLGEFQPCRWDVKHKGNARPIGDPVKDYYPAVIDLATWQKVQAKKKTNTPGRYDQSRGNLFSRITYDGYSGSHMRHIGRGFDPKRKALKDGTPYRLYYLVSDYQRLNPGAKTISWRYDWFEKWFLDYIIGLDWQAITQEKIPESEKGLEKSLAQAQHELEGIAMKLKRLTAFIATTEKPMPTVAAEMSKLEADKISQEAKIRELARELSNLSIRRASLTEAGTEFKDLIAQGDKPARLRLREEIRRRINRIDLFPNGAEAEHLKDEPVSAPGMPAFKITFVNGAIRWVFCDSRKPEQEAAAILDTGVPPAGMEVELRNRPEVVADTRSKPVKRKEVAVPVFVPKTSRRAVKALSSQKPKRKRQKNEIDMIASVKITKLHPTDPGK